MGQEIAAVCIGVVIGAALTLQVYVVIFWLGILAILVGSRYEML